jgi:RNA polymerase sigma factor (sigma-70 family)
MSTLEEAMAAVAGPEPAARIGVDELCDRYAARVYRFAAMLCPSRPDAEDLAQSALERAIRALPRTAPRAEHVEAWLWRIVVNVARDAGRAARRRQLLLERLLAHAPPPQTAAPEIEDSIGDEDLLLAVRSLTRRQRTLVALRFGADLDYRRIAAALGISPGAARVATHRALLALRAQLEARP